MSKTLKTAALIVGAVALVATGVGAAAGVGIGLGLSAGTLATIATVATIASVASGVLTLAVALTAKKPSAQATGSQTDFSADPDAGIPLVIGRTGTAGDITARFGFDTADKGDNDRQAFVVDLSLGPVAAVEGMTVDRNGVTYGPTGAAIGAFAGFMWSMTQIGAMPEPAALGFGVGAGSPPGWTAQHKKSGMAAATWTMRFDTNAKLFQNGVPAPMWTVRGARCYDPTKDSTYPGGNGAHRMADPADTAAYDAAMDSWDWTENPFLVGLHWAHGFWQRDRSNPNAKYQRVMGMGANWSGIDVAAFVEGRNIAQANGWKVGGMIYSGDNKWDSMKKILQAGMGEPLALGARISCFVNAPRVSLATITVDDVIGTGSVAATQPRRSRINTITPRYRLEENNWQLLPGAPISVAEHVTEDRGKRSKVQDYPFIQQTAQVATAVRYDIENAREFGPITLPLKLAWMGYKPGDCVTAVLPELGLNAQPILLLNRELGAASGVVTMTARSETAAKHPFALGQTMTPPPTPGVSGPPLTPVPGETAWAISGNSLVSGEATMPALIVTGAVDASTVDAVIVEYRPFTNGQGIDAGWVGVGAFPSDIARAEIGGLLGGTLYEVSVSYRRRGIAGTRRVLGPVKTSGVALDFAAVTGPSRPDDNATNSADLNSPLGGDTVGYFTQLVDRTVAHVDDLLETTAPIPDLTGKVDGLLTDVPRLSGEIGAIAQTTIPALTADIAGVGTKVGAIENVRLPALDASIVIARVETDTAQRRAEAAAADLANTLLRALTEADRTRIVMRDAGIYIDPATGFARQYATERQAEKISQVEVALNAVTAQVNLRATVNYVNEQIVKAQLTPGQAVDLNAIIARITSAELTIDGLKATLALTASASTVTALGGTITTLSQQLNALTGTISTKAESAAVDAISTRLSSAEQKIVAYGDVSSYSVELRQARTVADTNADALLSGLVSADDAARRRVAEQADLQFQLSSTIVAGLSAEAAQRIALAAQMAGNQASVTSSLSALVTSTSAQALQLTGLTASVEGQAAAIQQLSDLQVRADTSSAAVSTTLRQVQGDADAGADATLRALVAGDGTARANVQAMVQARTEMTTMIVAGQVAQAATNFSLLSRISTAQAAITSAQTALATLTAATTTRLDAAESAIGAANARLTAEENTRADAISAEAGERRALAAIINDPSTGLAATRASFTQQIETLADKQSATAQTVTGLGAAVEGNAGAIEDVRKVAVSATDATTSISTTLRQVTGAGDGSADAALRALVAGDSEALIRVGSIAQVHQDFTITRVGDRAQQALTNFSLLVKVDSAAAAIVEVRKVVADQNTATTLRFASAESAIGAANGRIDSEQQTRAEADAAEARAREALAAIVNNPTTGLPRTRADLLAQREVMVTANAANATDISALRTQVFDPATGLPQTRADLIEQKRVSAAADQINADQISQLQAIVADPNTGLAAAFAKVLAERQASIDRDKVNASATSEVSASLGTLGGRVTRAEEVQADLAGKVAARFQEVAQVADQVAGIRAVVELADGTITSNLALIAQAVGIWLQFGSQFIRAIGIELVDGVPVVRIYGEVLANSISTDKLKVNTAVVPGFASSTSPIVGTGIGADNFVSVLRTTITLAVAGVIDVDGGALQAFANYPSSPTAWQFGLYIDGHLEWAPGGQAPGDAVAIGGQRFCQAGTRTVELVWQGAPTATLRDRYLKIRGFNNTTN